MDLRTAFPIEIYTDYIEEHAFSEDSLGLMGTLA